MAGSTTDDAQGKRAEVQSSARDQSEGQASKPGLRLSPRALEWLKGQLRQELDAIIDRSRRT